MELPLPAMKEDGGRGRPGERGQNMRGSVCQANFGMPVNGDVK